MYHISQIKFVYSLFLAIVIRNRDRHSLGPFSKNPMCKTPCNPWFLSFYSKRLHHPSNRQMTKKKIYTYRSTPTKCFIHHLDQHLSPYMKMGSVSTSMRFVINSPRVALISPCSTLLIVGAYLTIRSSMYVCLLLDGYYSLETMKWHLVLPFSSLHLSHPHLP